MSSHPSIPPDYDSDPGRWQSWKAPLDVHEIVAPGLEGPVLDAGCGEGRLASLLMDDVRWVGLDTSSTQLAANPYSPCVCGDMASLPFRDGSFAEITHLWCLYHLDEPTRAIKEAYRVLRPGGRYFASTASRDSDLEVLPEGYPPSSFDAEEALSIVRSVFVDASVQTWDGHFYPLETREDVEAYLRHNFISLDRAKDAELPLWLTKRGVLVRAVKS